jgi:hypothetical protein
MYRNFTSSEKIRRVIGRGEDERSGELFSCVDLEARAMRDHPLRAKAQSQLTGRNSASLDTGMGNRHGLLIYACLTLADGHAERVATLHT